MNWKVVEVELHELEGLKVHNQAIYPKDRDLIPNAGVELRTKDGERLNAIYDGNTRTIRRMNGYNPQFHTMKNRDLELYNDHLLNPDVNTIVVNGFFGTGKTSTVCSHLVPGLEATLEQRSGGIPKAYIAKPHVGAGESYGFLPGDLFDKMEQELKSYTQYFERFGHPGLADILMMRGIDEQGKMAKAKVTPLQSPLLELLPFEYLRGRDVEEGWVILDEAQNTNRKEMTTFMSRPNDAAKMIISGDTTWTQIDRRGNTPENNGLSFAEETFKGKRYAGFVELQSVQHIIRGQRVRDLFIHLSAQTKTK